MNNKLIKKTNNKVSSIQSYNGVCHKCNSPISYDGTMTVVEVDNTDISWFVVPIDKYVCPFCGEIITGIELFKSLMIANELKDLEKAHE